MKPRPFFGRHAMPALALLCAAMVTGCNEEVEAPAEEGTREGADEVLEGTISDDMLPLDELRSQAPLAEPEPGEEGEGEADEESSASE